MPTILIVDDEPESRRVFHKALQRDGHIVVEAPDGQAALRLLESHSVDLILSDVSMPGLSGFALLKELRARGGVYVPVILISGEHCLDEDLLRGYGIGADDYMFKPCNLRELCARVQARLRLARQVKDSATRAGGESTAVQSPAAAAGKPGVGKGAGDEAEAGAGAGAGGFILGPDLAGLIEVLVRMAPSKAAVLLTGETGTGKGALARHLHRLSPRKDGPFVPVHCAGIPPDLLMAELFGHERGAYTGAGESHAGRCEIADGGTLFLDEIGDLTPAMQLTLLRFCEEGAFERLGSTTTIRVDVRVVAATHRDLEDLVSRGVFRRDLYYRLNVLGVHVPPLRERPRDVEVLAMELLARAAQRLGKTVRGFDPRALDLMRGHDWPGNVRELNNVIERAVVFAGDEIIGARDIQLQPRMRVDAEATRRTTAPEWSGGGEGAGGAGGGLVDSLASIERERLVEALRQAGGNQSRAAKALGLPRTTLITKLLKHGIRG